MIDLTKTCTVCNVKKNLEEFTINNAGYKYGRHSQCKTCLRNKRKDKPRILNDADKEKKRLKSAIYRRDNSEKFKWSVKKACYKQLGLDITKEQYDDLHKKQEGRCAICGKEPNGFKKSLCLDHCHDTLKVRGFLCDNCNAGLGKFKDSVDNMKKAIQYLETFKSTDGF